MGETNERKVGGTEPVESNDSVSGESVAVTSNHDLQQRVASPRREACRNSGDNTNGQDREENGESVAKRL